MMNVPSHTPGKTYEPYEIEDAANHLMAAQKVKDNPELHAHAMKHLTKMKGHITSIEQIRQKGRELDKADNSMEEAVETPKMEAAERNGAVGGKKELEGASVAEARKAPVVKGPKMHGA